MYLYPLQGRRAVAVAVPHHSPAECRQATPALGSVSSRGFRVVGPRLPGALPHVPGPECRRTGAEDTIGRHSCIQGVLHGTGREGEQEEPVVQGILGTGEIRLLSNRHYIHCYHLMKHF